MVERLRGSRTIVMIAHRLSTIRRCGVLDVLDPGRIVATDGSDELSRHHGNCANMLEANRHPMPNDDCDNPFADAGGDYARYRPDYPRELVDALAAACSAHDHALDVGCGNGQLTRRLIERFARCTAIDPSATQIAAATRHPRIDYRVGSCECMPVADHSVDLIVAAQAAHWFDLPRFYAEARRVAREGAGLALVSYAVPEFEPALQAAFRTFYDGPLHDYWPAARRHVEADYRTLDFPFTEQRIDGIVIERDWRWAEMAGYIDTWSATRRARDAGADSLWRDSVERFARTWGDASVRHRVRWPVTVRFAAV